MLISKVSINSNLNNFNLVDEWVNTNQRIDCNAWWCDDVENKIYISIADDMTYKLLNSFLKCNNISYEVEAIKGSKEEIKSEYHYLIEG
ncbi:MAG: hypothetical protein ACRC7S_08965 [Cetobacterium sp.]